MRKIIAFALVSAIALQPQKVEANPAAIAAPVAFCAGTAGLGCVLVATTVISGVAYYVWRRSDGKKTYVAKTETGKTGYAIYADNEADARSRCRRMAARQGKVGKLLSKPKRDVSGGIYYVCEF
jgi:hypothetical protein